ncbi:hypothetical protein U1Q18_001352 [Sarracenia purpurea var. burkii]
MSFSRFPSPLYLLCFAFLIQIAVGANPLFHFCSTSDNFTANGPYETNLNKLMGYLYFKTPPTGFGSGSIGDIHDRANGLALCRDDVNNTDCKSCVAEAGAEIRKLCPYNKGGIVWYDECLFKYSNLDFFGTIDNQNKFYMWNVRNVSNPVEFNRKTRELLSGLSDLAYASPKLFAAGESELRESTKLYGLVQCTRDLSSSECKKCLADAIDELPSCCDGKEGGRVVCGSCTVHYEIYPIVNA